VLSPRFKAVKEAFRNVGVSMPSLKRLIEGIEDGMRINPPDANAFLAKGTAIGGITRLKNALTLSSFGGAGAMAAGPLGGAGGIAVLTASRYMAKIVTDPKMLRLSNVSLDTNISQNGRKIALRVLLDALGVKFETEGSAEFVGFEGTIEGFDKRRVQEDRPALVVGPPQPQNLPFGIGELFKE